MQCTEEARIKGECREVERSAHLRGDFPPPEAFTGAHLSERVEEGTILLDGGEDLLDDDWEMDCAGAGSGLAACGDEDLDAADTCSLMTLPDEDEDKAGTGVLTGEGEGDGDEDCMEVRSVGETCRIPIHSVGVMGSTSTLTFCSKEWQYGKSLR